MATGEHWMSGVEQVIPFAMVPRGLIEDDRVKAYHIAAFATLASFANRAGECWPGTDKVRSLSGIGKNTWPKILSDLQEWGWVEVIPRYSDDGRQMSNKYRLHGRGSTNRDREGPEIVTHPVPDMGDKQEPVEQEPKNYIKHPQFHVRMNQTRYDNLVGQYGQATVDDAIQSRMDWEAAHGKKKASDYAAAAANWIKNAKKFSAKTTTSELESLLEMS